MGEIKTVGDLKRELRDVPDDMELSVTDGNCGNYAVDCASVDKKHSVCTVWLLQLGEDE